jgi:SAM-dependent methyltransferase
MIASRRPGIFLASILISCFLGTFAQAPASNQTSAQSRPTSTPYAGDLSIFEYKDRDRKLQIDRVMDLLDIGPGKSVADVGAGSGWFTVRAAARVGATGNVYAEDINPAAIDYIKRRTVKEKLGNIHTVLGTVDDPGLPDGSMDAMLIMKTYHEFAKPIPLMIKLRKALRPGAKVGIIDRNGDGTDHGIMAEIVEREMAKAGFRRLAKYDFTKADGQDYFLIFQSK